MCPDDFMTLLHSCGNLSERSKCVFRYQILAFFAVHVLGHYSSFRPPIYVETNMLCVYFASQTNQRFVHPCFLLPSVFKIYVRRVQTEAIILSCMSWQGECPSVCATPSSLMCQNRQLHSLPVVCETDEVRSRSSQKPALPAVSSSNAVISYN